MAETVEQAYYNSMKRRSTQPSKQTLPQIIGAVAPKSRQVVQSCEKVKEPGNNGDVLSDKTISVGPTTAAIIETNNNGYLNPKPSVASHQSSVMPTGISAVGSFSTSRRPKN